MLLIICLGLIAKLALVSCDCDFGPLPLNDFDLTKFSDNRTWCYKYYTSDDDFLNNLDCLKITFSSPEEKSSALSTDIYDKSEQLHIIQYGYITNFNSSGCYEFYHPEAIWTGTHCITSTDYVHYRIIKVCPFDSNKLYIYVGFRSCHPDEAKKNDVLKALKDNNIDVGQLVEFSTDHCQQAESSTEGGSST